MQGVSSGKTSLGVRLPSLVNVAQNSRAKGRSSLTPRLTFIVSFHVWWVTGALGPRSPGLCLLVLRQPLAICLTDGPLVLRVTNTGIVVEKRSARVRLRCSLKAPFKEIVVKHT